MDCVAPPFEFISVSVLAQIRGRKGVAWFRLTSASHRAWQRARAGRQGLVLPANVHAIANSKRACGRAGGRAGVHVHSYIPTLCTHR